MIGVDSWKGIGYIMVILLAGLQTIPKDLYEAAAIDGAGAWAKFRHITLPMLMPALMIVTVLNVLYGLRVFDMVYALTNGGPGYATEVLSTEIFKAFFQGSVRARHRHFQHSVPDPGGHRLPGDPGDGTPVGSRVRRENDAQEPCGRQPPTSPPLWPVW